MQNVRRAHKLHIPGGAEHGVLLAQPAGGRVLHQRPQALLPRLLAVRTTSQGPPKPHPGSFHCCPHPGHPPDDSAGCVEE